jgi:hypothetical protein
VDRISVRILSNSVTGKPFALMLSQPKDVSEEDWQSFCSLLADGVPVTSSDRGRAGIYIFSGAPAGAPGST